jgi:hypothetical protein
MGSVIEISGPTSEILHPLPKESFSGYELMDQAEDFSCLTDRQNSVTILSGYSLPQRNIPTHKKCKNAGARPDGPEIRNLCRKASNIFDHISPSFKKI